MFKRKQMKCELKRNKTLKRARKIEMRKGVDKGKTKRPNSGQKYGNENENEKFIQNCFVFLLKLRKRCDGNRYYNTSFAHCSCNFLVSQARCHCSSKIN